MCSLQQVAFLNWLRALPAGRYEGLGLEAEVNGCVWLAFWDDEDVVVLESCQNLTETLCAA